MVPTYEPQNAQSTPNEGPVTVAHQRSRWRVGLLFLSGGLTGCDLLTGSAPGPSTIVISPSAIVLDAIGATQILSAEVRDQNNAVLTDEVVAWSSSSPNIAAVSSTGRVTAAGSGMAVITATAGTASGSANVSVTQLATVLEKVSGDRQLGAAAEPLPELLVVQAYDRLGNPASSVPVEFQILEGSGNLTPAQTQTDPRGRASTTWTLGAFAGAAQSVRAFLSFRVGEGVDFEATAVPGLPAGIVIVAGDGQAAPRLSTLLEPLTVRIEDRVQNPVGGVTVEFAVIEGSGSVQPSAKVTDAEGLATTLWTLGEPLGDQRVSVMVQPSVSATVAAIATTVPEQVEILEGEGQMGIVGERLPDSPSVQVFGSGGAPVSSLDVHFSAGQNGGVLESTGGAEGSAHLTVRTDENGVATVGGWILGATAGIHEVTVEVPGLSPVILTAEAEAGPPALIGKVSGDRQTGVVGTVLGAPLVVRVTDALGNPLAGSTVTFGPVSGDGSIVPTQAATEVTGTAETQWTLGSTRGTQSIGASIEAGPTVAFTATATDESGIAGLVIELLFIDAPTVTLRQAFDDAVVRWGDLLGELQPIPVELSAGACGPGSPAINQLVDDLLVLVKLESIDGVSGTLGQAGVCSARLENRLPVVAKLTLDTDDVGCLEGTARLVDLIVHELGHALGFGTLWAGEGLLQDPSLPASKGADTHFNGPDAIAAFDAIGGDAYTGGQKVPVENEEGGVGTRDSHWRLSVLSNELMTGFLTAGANPLSRVTVASLGDLGYDVDEGKADAFQLNLFAAPPREGGQTFPLGDDVLRGPVYLLDDEGRIRGVLE